MGIDRAKYILKKTNTHLQKKKKKEKKTGKGDGRACMTRMNPP